MIHGSARLANLPVVPIPVFGGLKDHQRRIRELNNRGYREQVLCVYIRLSASLGDQRRGLSRAMERWYVTRTWATYQRLGVELEEPPIVRVPGKTRMSKSGRGTVEEQTVHKFYEIFYRMKRKKWDMSGVKNRTALAALRSYKTRHADRLTEQPFWRRIGLTEYQQHSFVEGGTRTIYIDLSDIPF